MSFTLNQLITILCLIVCIMLPVLYSLVITCLYLKSVKDNHRLNKDYDELEELADRKIKHLEEQLNGGSRPRKSNKDEITCGFAIPKEGEKKEEKD